MWCSTTVWPKATIPARDRSSDSRGGDSRRASRTAAVRPRRFPRDSALDARRALNADLNGSCRRSPRMRRPVPRGSSTPGYSPPRRHSSAWSPAHRPESTHLRPAHRPLAIHPRSWGAAPSHGEPRKPGHWLRSDSHKSAWLFLPGLRYGGVVSARMLNERRTARLYEQVRTVLLLSMLANENQYRKKYNACTNNGNLPLISATPKDGEISAL